MTTYNQENRLKFQAGLAHTLRTDAFILVFAFASVASAISQSDDNGDETRLAARPATTAIPLKGVSKGGTVALSSRYAISVEPIGKAKFAWVVVTNQPGDSAVVVAERLAGELRALGVGVKVKHTNDTATLILPGGGGMFADWLIGGTDLGFNIPPPPRAVTVSFDPGTDQVTVHWENPPGGYDSIEVFQGDGFFMIARLAGSATSATFTLGPGPWRGPPYVLVLGKKDGVPSPGGPILISDGVQKVLMNVPFWQGIAPGFEAWTYNSSAGASGFQEGTTVDRKLIGIKSKEGICQIVRVRGPGCAGVMRRFLGLKPGHTYRVSARLNVLEAGDGDWAFSLHAAVEQPGRTPLTPEQLAGVAELPTGAKGITAAQIARCDSTRYAAGQWVTVSSGIKGSDNVAGDITLPQSSDSITVWCRLQGPNMPNAAVAAGLDSLAIEDLGRK
ncbi:MAG: hypothetical protein NZ739_09015 [Verrucomicrobiae bacterium]|nr:hypothetical protein [Verrucomicrobiae bacterium]MDW7979490.1 hypothetical protein [Verrucomicrobiales bacterium]